MFASPERPRRLLDFVYRIASCCQQKGVLVGLSPAGARELELFYHKKRMSRRIYLVEILTSNLSFNLWDEIFSDPAIAILDPHHSTTINIQGKSERGKTNGQSGRGGEEAVRS